MEHNQRLYRRERLRSTRAIGRLFDTQTGAPDMDGEERPRPQGVMAYPWRAVWLPADPVEAPRVDFVRILVMVPKRRLRHAVDRVAMRRRLREAYRRLRSEIVTEGTAVDIAFIYIADKLTPYDESARALRRIFKRVNAALHPDDDTQS